MLPVQRLKNIEELLKEKGSLVISRLSKEFDVSEETIRRDIEKLSKTVNFKRVYGGIYIPEIAGGSVPIRIREHIFIEEKQLLAKESVKQIIEGDSIILDSSSTALHIAKELKRRKIKVTVITNSTKIIDSFHGEIGIKLIALGGRVTKSNNSSVGSITINALKTICADKVFISSPSVDTKFGLTDDHEEESQVRAQMLQRGVKCFLVVDHTKLTNPSLYKIAGFENIDCLILDGEIPKEDLIFYKENKIKIISVNK